MQFLDFTNKAGFKQDELRRRREEQQVEIRRQKREENITKRRNFLPSTGPDSDDEASTSNWEAPVWFIYLNICAILSYNFNLYFSSLKSSLVAFFQWILSFSSTQPQSSVSFSHRRRTHRSKRSLNAALSHDSLSSLGEIIQCFRYVILFTECQLVNAKPARWSSLKRLGL